MQILFNRDQLLKSICIICRLLLYYNAYTLSHINTDILKNLDSEPIGKRVGMDTSVLHDLLKNKR